VPQWHDASDRVVSLIKVLNQNPQFQHLNT